MREIKFRGKNKADNQWYYGSENPNPDNDNDLNLSLFWQEVADGWITRETVGQSTGREDITEKECFHKDICNYKDDSGTAQTGVVEWSCVRTAYYLRAIGGDEEGNQDGDLDRDFEIIGNIHYNPELNEQ